MTETLSGTAFGRILGAIMQARGIPAEPEQVRALAERAGIDAEGLVALATSEPQRDVGPLNGLADELAPNEDQKKALAMAYAYDCDIVVEAIRRSAAFNAAYTVVEDSEDLDPGERERVLGLLRVEGKSAAREAERLKAAIGEAGPRDV